MRIARSVLYSCSRIKCRCVVYGMAMGELFECELLNGKYWGVGARELIHILRIYSSRFRNKNKIYLLTLNRYTVEYFSSDLQTGWVVAVHRYPGHMVTVSSICRGRGRSREKANKLIEK